MRSYLNPESNEENGYLRLSQRCARCAYVSTTKVDNLLYLHSEDIATDEFVCLRHGQSLTLEESMSFTCDYFC